MARVKRSQLLPLCPRLGNDGCLRIRGRLQNSDFDYDARHPAILPKGHPVTKTTIVFYHLKFLHVCPQALLGSLGQKYLIFGQCPKQCVRCFRIKAPIFQYVMGSLPADRVRSNTGFHTAGIDFCGPFFYKAEARNKPPHKCFISIFVCFSTKALMRSAAAFIAALTRFISIRGKPRTLWSDNATNFMGATNELAELKELFKSEPSMSNIAATCLSKGNRLEVYSSPFTPLRRTMGNGRQSSEISFLQSCRSHNLDIR